MTNVTQEKKSAQLNIRMKHVQDGLNFTFNLNINLEVLADWFEQHLSVSLVREKIMNIGLDVHNVNLVVFR